ncbi:MAG TPA: heparan-alpha-glucosaminide N-acetyltransferase domain-containing protein, partial [Terriglobales bacterium]
MATTTGVSTATAPKLTRLPLSLSRIASVDFARGVAMILMAIDHVRVYSGVPAGGPTPGIFLTRWITNFVAPAFVFLAGTAAFLHGRKLANRSALSRFLLVRGIWLIFLELTILRVAWTFNFDFAHYMLAGVIWMLGWCMIIMSAAVYLPTRAVGIIGLLIIALHNVTDLFRGQLAHTFGEAGPNWLLKLLYFGGAIDLGPSGPPLLILYVIVPWIGVMMAGY